MSVVKCLQCGKIMWSQHRHDFIQCSCDNETFVDGGDVYTRIGGKDLSKIKVLKNCLTCKHAEFVDYVAGPRCFAYRCNHPLPDCVSKNDKHWVYLRLDTNEVRTKTKSIEDCSVWECKDES